MSNEAPAAAIARLRVAWEEEVRPSARRALVALAFAVLFAAAHLARIGSPAARAGAAAALAITLIGLVARALVRRRRRADLRRIIRDTIGQLDPELGGATLRAITLAERTAQAGDVGSPVLASLHLTRLLGRAPSERIAARAARAGAMWSRVGVALAAAAAVAVLVEPIRIVEGLDVLAASDGEAPLLLAWLDDVEMLAAPPEYLHQPAHPMAAFSTAAEPRGTTITVHGRPVRAGRALVITDGSTDEPFIEDGAGGLVARWHLGDSTSLWIAARFGAVHVRQPDEEPVASIPDTAPVVTVEGAPRTTRLLDEPSIPIHYTVTDDHGLREVNLVLRAGEHEERRVLSRPIDALTDRGGYEVTARDPFFKRTYVPVSITVEARDNDTVSGPKWGKSAPILVIPPQVGEPEARRYAALVEARGALTDLTAFRLSESPDAADANVRGGAAGHLKRENEAQATAVTAVENALDGDYGGLRIRGRMVGLARGQLRRLASALGAERTHVDAANHRTLLGQTEEVLLAFDAGVRAVGIRDTRALAKRLAGVADEAAAAASLLESGSERKTEEARLDAAVQVLDGAGAQLVRLGDLGLDLGEIVQNDLRRIARARAANDAHHAELAARDLAARLRRPEPSFVGGGGHGVEAGSGSGSGSGSAGEGEASPADQEAAKIAQELEEITRDHAAQVDEVEQALDKAAPADEIKALKDELKQHAEAIREAVKKLPQQNRDPGSAEGAAAAGRESAEAMAGALEGGDLKGATEKGKRASTSLEEAKRAGDQAGGFLPDERVGRDAGKAREAIERELGWAQGVLDKLRKAASEHAKDDLKKAGQSEKSLSERARELAKKGDRGDGSLPQDVLDHLDEAGTAMGDAEKALREGDGERGLRAQKDAQRLLEMARDPSDDEDKSEGEGEGEGEGKGKSESEGGKKFVRKGDIPDKNKHKGPDAFRRRVLEGLGGSADPLLREAVKRYAEGLLK